MPRNKMRKFLIEPFEPTRIIKAEQPSEEGLSSNDVFKYATFPDKLEQELYYKARKLNYYKEDSQRSVHRQVVGKQRISTMNEVEWAKFMAESIYCMWFHIFGATLTQYR